ncbi:uncharacterized protein MELLADRAFT_103506 [Melampsora larici-populina 98AG31]|uniref:Uncharacterized protein n=1 Tax=Melampsora larici-populina (strain 98AG31 / pathotype 3-4-7) TaxID=747676 RepID=F4RBK1_MELLP|nr:uncharacterized protein MELLADRAFT_103506 [Melampsora larici-populina 98AG31]EGG10324.1 hypothetical protein MELLADRAFT_103506 [Melampsora larici-populina 98AG31]
MIQAIKLAEEKKKAQEEKELEQAEMRRRRAESRVGTATEDKQRNGGEEANQGTSSGQITNTLKSILDIKKEFIERTLEDCHKEEDAEELEKMKKSIEDMKEAVLGPGESDKADTEDSESEELEVIERTKKKKKGKAKKKSSSVSSTEDEEWSRERNRKLGSVIEADQIIPGREPAEDPRRSSSKKLQDNRPLLDRLVDALEGRSDEDLETLREEYRKKSALEDEERKKKEKDELEKKRKRREENEDRRGRRKGDEKGEGRERKSEEEISSRKVITRHRLFPIIVFIIILRRRERSEEEEPKAFVRRRRLRRRFRNRSKANWRQNRKQRGGNRGHWYNQDETPAGTNTQPQTYYQKKSMGKEWVALGQKHANNQASSSSRGSRGNGKGYGKGDR